MIEIHRVIETEATEEFWNIRAAKYDKLYWTKDQSYIDAIIELGELEPHHLALDVGTGTGTIARAIRPHVKHVVAVDPSSAMLAQGKWEDVSIIKWNISESFFADHIFHRVFARMVFHHIMDNLDAAILRCYDILKDGGRIIVAEGVPPEDDPEIVNWYTQMFKLKEDRRTFLPAQLVYFLQKNGFRDVKCVTHYMDNFSIRNWLENSGLDPTRQEAILELHRTAPAAVRNAYQLIERNGDVLIRTKNVVVVGER